MSGGPPRCARQRQIYHVRSVLVAQPRRRPCPHCGRPQLHAGRYWHRGGGGQERLGGPARRCRAHVRAVCRHC
eukprot:10733868-Lingulodinium_polyedra.AAC.1